MGKWLYWQPFLTHPAYSLSPHLAYSLSPSPSQPEANPACHERPMAGLAPEELVPMSQFLVLLMGQFLFELMTP